MKFILDHYYAVDHNDYCRVIEADHGIEDFSEILAAIQFFYEDNFDDSTNPTFDSIIDILCRHYGFKKLDKNKLSHDVAEAIEEAYLRDYDINIYTVSSGEKYAYINMYVTREEMCWLGRVEELHEKWLTDKIKEDLKKTLITET